MILSAGDTVNFVKKRRNIICRLCGGGMTLSFLAFIVCTLLKIAPWNMLFYSEAVALFFFGVAWLV
jgi:uncharacterized membrane protein